MLSNAVPEFLSKQSKRTLLLLGLAFNIAVGIADYVTGREIDVDPFYLLPILSVSVFAGFAPGAAMVVVSAAIAVTVDALTMNHYPNMAVPLWNAAMTSAAFLFTVRVGMMIKTALERQQELARTDNLTGGMNRRAFTESIDNEIARARRHRHPFAVAYIDLDNFKAVNDQLGHHTGDRLLRQATDEIKNSVRAHDLVARLGGDEFAILLPETGRDAAQAVVERIQRRVSETLHREHWPVTLSVGVVTFLSPPDSVDDVMRIADEAMYSAKRGGRNMIRQNTFGVDSA